VSIEKREYIGSINVRPNGLVEIQEVTEAWEGEEFIGKSYHRFVEMPGFPHRSKDPTVIAVCNAVHTPAVIAAFKATVKADN